MKKKIKKSAENPLNTKYSESHAHASHFSNFDTLILNLALLFFSYDVIFYNFEISSVVPGEAYFKITSPFPSRPDGRTSNSQSAAVGS